MAVAGAIAMAAAINNLDGARNDTRFKSRAVYVDPNLPAPDQFEALLGRKLRPVPPHLTNRILYLPSHDEKVTHLPIYDFTTDFNEAVKDEPIGSSRFKTSFGLMHKPIGDGRGTSKVSYLVDFEPLESRRSLADGGTNGMAHRRKGSLAGLVTKATIQRRMLYGGGAEVGLTIPPREQLLDAGKAACTITPSSTTLDIPLQVSFPVPPTTSKFSASRNAWLTFTVPNLLDDERTLQWQIHPVEQGMLRYTLVEIPRDGNSEQVRTRTPAEDEHPDATSHLPFSASHPDNEPLIRAIYHNVGLGFSLSQPYSEGALWLQSDLDAELEALIVASLLGLLWRARGEENRPRKVSKSEASGGGPAATPARKSSVDEGGKTTGQGKKGILGKILRRK